MTLPLPTQSNDRGSPRDRNSHRRERPDHGDQLGRLSQPSRRVPDRPEKLLEPYLYDLCGDCQRQDHTNPLDCNFCCVTWGRRSSRRASINRAGNTLRCSGGPGHAGYPISAGTGMVRGLDYYTRTVFEIVHGEWVEPRQSGEAVDMTTSSESLGVPTCRASGSPSDWSVARTAGRSH